MSSANAFSLVQSGILSFGKEVSKFYFVICKTLPIQSISKFLSFDEELKQMVIADTWPSVGGKGNREEEERS